MHENNQLRSNKCKILLFSRNQFTYAADYTKCQPNNVNISSIYFNALKVKNHNRKKIDKQLCLFLVFSYNAFYRTGVRRNFFFFVHFSFYHFTQVSLVVFFCFVVCLSMRLPYSQTEILQRRQHPMLNLMLLFYH